MPKKTPPHDPDLSPGLEGSLGRGGERGQDPKTPGGVHAMRRGGARREATERVTLNGEDGRVLEGWALNVSRGGVRAIVEEKVVLGQKFDVGVGTEDVAPRPSRVVWIQEEPDGVIVGLEFTGLSGTHKAVPAAALEADDANGGDRGGGASED